MLGETQDCGLPLGNDAVAKQMAAHHVDGVPHWERSSSTEGFSVGRRDRPPQQFDGIG